ncbi:MAG: coniferyl aldehyde dehydrogenase [Pseudomonadota bacterium]
MSSVYNLQDASPETNALDEALTSGLEIQRAAYFREPTPSLRARRDDLRALKRLVTDNVDAIVEAISSDYGNRSRHETLFAEVFATTDGINDNIKKLRQWMKPQHRESDQFLFPGSKNRVIPQPLGVVGLIVPWNFPLFLSFSQLAAAFAAGNRAMVKMSENSVQLTRLLKTLSPQYLPEDKLCFYEETGSVGIQFSQLPFDLMIFTGSGQTGRAVMASAAKNLTPVILELGGKCPAVIDPKYPLDRAVERIFFAKQFNAGQICTNVDYVFVHESQKDAFVEKAKAYVAEHCPDPEHSDYTSIIDERAYNRLMATLDDARNEGATIVNLSPLHEPNASTRKVAMHLVLDTTDAMRIRHRETFGPFMMVLTYTDPSDVIDYVNAHDRPLAFYPFSHNKKLVARYIDRIMSGGVTVNDVLLHVAQHDLPFGGVGPSGMGHYHGYEGFLACSKLRPVFYQARFSALRFLAPPYGRFADWVMDFLVRLKR